MKLSIQKQLRTILAAALLLPAPGWAHEEGKKDPQRNISSEEHAFGRAGDPKRVTRTIHVDMSDKMRFTPSEITVKPAETVRFVVKNSGKVMHEMVLGTMDQLKKHAELMKKFPGMEHDEPYMAHVSSGRSANLYWQFTQPGEFHFGCLVPGHWEAGMRGKITVK
jgi:uncharacterized cupredoxin-like copper-binding protein